MGRTFRFNKKDGSYGGKPKSKSGRSKKKTDLKRGYANVDYDMSEASFERFTRNGKPRKP